MTATKGLSDMKPVLVGSRALEYHVNDFKCRDNADWDLIVDATWANVTHEGNKVETHTVDELNNLEIVTNYALDDGPDLNPVVNGIECNVMSMEGLAIMKRSHLWRSHQFDKHITMYHKYLAGYLPDDEQVKELLSDRIKLTKKAYPQGNPKLNQSNKDFFDDKVDKKFDHDWIHELVAYYDRPLFEKLKRDGEEDSAWCVEDLWDEPRARLDGHPRR